MNPANAIPALFSNPAVQAFGWALVHFVWQGAAIAVLLAGLLQILRRRSANARYLAACAALALMAACLVATYCWVRSAAPSQLASVPAAFLPLPSGESAKELLTLPSGGRAGVRGPADGLGSIDADSPVSQLDNTPRPWTERFEPALPWLVGIWLLGVTVLSLRLLAGWLQVQRMKRRGTRLAPDGWQTRLDELAARLRVSRPVRLVESALIEVPTVIGWLRPIILVSASALIGLTPQQLEALIAHELAHIRRHDYLVNLLQSLVETLLFYHPAVWWVSRRIRAEREHCCDDLAIQSCCDRHSYARALVTMEELRNAKLRFAVAAAGGSLLRRVRRLVAKPEPHVVGSTCWLAVVVALAVAFTAGVGLRLSALSAHGDRDFVGAPADPERRVPETAADSKLAGDSQTRPQPPAAAKLPGRLFVVAGLRTAQDERRFVQDAIAIDPSTGRWTLLQNLKADGFIFPLSPVRVSPDGRTMLFMPEKEQGKGELWRCDAPTGEHAERVLEKGSPAAWSPDGTSFVVRLPKGDSPYLEVENWLVHADTLDRSKLTLADDDAVEDWSPDGQGLLVVSRKAGHISLVKPDGGDRRRITTVADFDSFSDPRPRISPDGRRLVYLRVHRSGNETAPRVTHDLRTINIDGTDDREILGERQVDPTSNPTIWTAPLAARWSPDGTHLAVVLFDHTGSGSVAAIGGNWRLAIIDADGGNLRELKLDGVLNAVLPWDGPEWRLAEAPSR